MKTEFISMEMEKKRPWILPAIWGGIECSITRVNDQYRDQLDYAGHYKRAEDIQLFAELGIRAMRYPILWEKHQPEQYGETDWHWITHQLDELRNHNIEPIAGLLHHGSGPRFTDLSDENFAIKFAAYAASVARQFPWLTYYTPVNEPLTTARFSGLYGIWYPHKSDELSFFKMLLNQLKATVLAMREIRKINPAARLAQTEDLSKTHSTSLLTYQACFENERRWLTYDLLCGMVRPGHFFYDYFIDCGIAREDILFFAENPCPPDIMGFNYYVTSERYLDENLHCYPPVTYGGNGRHNYADVEAVRSGHMQGIGPLLQEAWERYHIPLAVTECHICCTPDEQVRWVYENHTACVDLIKKGIDIKAFTAWCLLGAFDWNSLLVKQDYCYECGVFDIREKSPSPTLLAKMIQSLSATGSYKHALLTKPGWWRPTHVPQLTDI